jgi:dynein heavy chain
LEDINNLLDSGDIPNLFAKEDFIPLLDKLRVSAKRDGRTDLLESGTTPQFYDYFKDTVK